jgi:UDP-glucose 4-epimerase
VRFLVTGGAGFVGSHLVDALLARGDGVVVLDNLQTGAIENVPGAAVFVKGSDNDASLVGELMSEVDACFHLAAAVGVRRIMESPLQSLLENVRGVEVVTRAAAAMKKRLLFTSTSEAYGRPVVEALHEGSDRVFGPTSTVRWGYAASKVVGEMMVYGYARERGCEMMAVRLFNTVGPRQREMVLPLMVDWALRGEDVIVHGDGGQTRCFCHVADVVDALQLLMAEDAAVGGIFNVGSSQEVTIRELAERVIAICGSPSRIKHVAPDYGPGFDEIRRRKPNLMAIHNLVGWKPRRSLDDAIADVVRSFGCKPSAQRSSLKVSR